MEKISQKTLEMVLDYGVYDTRKYRYRAKYHNVFIKGDDGNYHAKTFVRVQRMPMEYIGTTSMLVAGAWETIVDIEV